MNPQDWQKDISFLLKKAGIPCGEGFKVKPLQGGVSSDIVLISLNGNKALHFCAKRALPKLKVKDDWFAPIERNRFEMAWLTCADKILPKIAPKVLAQDEEKGIALIEYLAPEKYVLWKDKLLAGNVDPNDAKKIGTALGTIHNETLQNKELAAHFSTDAFFNSLRLEPYLKTLISRYPDLSAHLNAIIKTTAETKIALVHGDISPKNIFIEKSTGQPVFIDAECAWYGDPIFDIAFCLNHLLLKALHLPASSTELLASFEILYQSWLVVMPPSMQTELAARTAALLPALFLARVDGKSPVEYLNESTRETVRSLGLRELRNPGNLVTSLSQKIKSIHSQGPRKNSTKTHD
ncbi:MAG: phosphotransferase [Opitutaceae bacterium]|nr:phosphotransferase [Opitutaceae bacterium]